MAGFQMPHLAIIVALVCVGVGLLFHIIGLATASWLTTETAVGDFGYGLWSACHDRGSCTSYNLIPDWLDAVRAFSLLGLLVLVGALVVGVLIMFLDNNKLSLIAAILSFVAALCLLIEFAVFAGEREETFGTGPDLGYSFALTIVAFLLCLAGGVCFILPKVLA